jgi:glycosyltransferase involved in cell wall biosynthesis
MTPRFSVFILTYNEQANIERCLKSLVDFTDDVVIIDSYSTDETLDICRHYGARIMQNKFVNHGVQSNWALENGGFKYDWIIRLDSDELLPTKLKRELDGIAETAAPDVTTIYLNRRQYFMNRWLKHGGIYPHHILRAFRKGCGAYEEKTEEHFIPRFGRSVMTKNDFLEDNRNNTMDFWLLKHADLARGEVADTLGLTYGEGPDLKPSLTGEKIARTRWFKVNVYQNAPLFLRAVLYFLYRYFIRLGFLDGTPGLIYFFNQSFWYRFFVDSKIYEARSRWTEITPDYSDI